MPSYNERYGLSSRMGKVLADGRLVVVRGVSALHVNDGDWHCIVPIFDACRTVHGGHVRRSRVTLIGGHRLKHPREYIIVPNAFANLIMLYGIEGNYAGLSLQGFLMKTWRAPCTPPPNNPHNHSDVIE